MSEVIRCSNKKCTAFIRICDAQPGQNCVCDKCMALTEVPSIPPLGEAVPRRLPAVLVLCAVLTCGLAALPALLANALQIPSITIPSSIFLAIHIGLCGLILSGRRPLWRVAVVLPLLWILLNVACICAVLWLVVQLLPPGRRIELKDPLFIGTMVLLGIEVLKMFFMFAMVNTTLSIEGRRYFGRVCPKCGDFEAQPYDPQFRFAYCPSCRLRWTA